MQFRYWSGVLRNEGGEGGDGGGGAGAGAGSGGDGGAGAGAAAPPAAPPTGGAPTSGGPVGTATGVPIVDAGDGGGAGTKPDDKGDDDDGGDDGKPIMSQEQFNERVGRARESEAKKHRKFLMDTWGTDNPDEIAKKQARLKELEEGEDKRKRAAMSEQQRLQADLEKERKAREAAEQRAQQLQEEQLYTQQDAVISRVAGKHIDPDYIEDVNIMFARHLKSLDKKDLDAFDERKMDKWFKDFAAKKPAFARKGDEPSPAPPAKKPVTSGAPPRGKPAPTPSGSGGAGKVARPGQPNSMSKGEFHAHLRSKGLSPY